MNPRPTRAQIDDLQAAKLGEMIRVLYRQNKFYGPRLKAAGLSSFYYSDLLWFFERVPFTTKAEILEDQEANPPYGSNLTYPLQKYTRFCQTSGTSGTPMRWLDTSKSWTWMVDNWVRVLRESGVRLGDRIFFAFSFGPFLGFWTAFEAGVKIGCLCLPGGGMSSSARIRSILDNEATVLCCTPTYAIRLGEVAVEEEIDMAGSRVRLIIAAGEPGAGIPTVRARIERLWPGARVKDHHGMTEIGPVSYECPDRKGVLHIIEHSFIPEVIDPNSGDQLTRGQTGELVLTNLGRIGSPLLRYRTGDLVQTAAAVTCACGSDELALEGGIIGRVDDMVVIRGVNVHPSAVEEVVRRFDEVAEYRALVCTDRGMADLRLEIEPALQCANPGRLAVAIEDELRTVFNLRVPVSAVASGALPRFELKAKRWIRDDIGGARG